MKRDSWEKLPTRIILGGMGHPAIGRTSLAEARGLGLELLRELHRYGLVRRFELVGSIRRGCADVGDVDVVVEAADKPKLMEWFGQMFGRKSNGSPRMSGVIEDVKFDFYVATPETWGSHLFLLTGTRAYTGRCRRVAESHGLSLRRDGVWRGDVRLAGDSERAVFMALGLKYLDPERRVLTR